MALKPPEKPPDLRDGQSRVWLQIATPEAASEAAF